MSAPCDNLLVRVPMLSQGAKRSRYLGRALWYAVVVVVADRSENSAQRLGWFVNQERQARRKRTSVEVVANGGTTLAAAKQNGRSRRELTGPDRLNVERCG